MIMTSRVQGNAHSARTCCRLPPMMPTVTLFGLQEAFGVILARLIKMQYAVCVPKIRYSSMVLQMS